MTKLTDKELRKRIDQGMKIEIREHGIGKRVARKLSTDHIMKNKNYYRGHR